MFKRLYHFIHHSSRHFWDFIGNALLDQVLVSGISFFVGFFLAKHLGVTLFGQFSLLMLIAYFCLEIQRALIIAPMMTLLAQKDDTAYLFQLGYLQMILNLILSVGAAFFVAASGYLFPKWGIGALSTVTCFTIFARLQQEFLRRVFFVQVNSRLALILDAITFSSILVSLLALEHSHRLTLDNVMWWHVAGYLCPSFLFMRYVLPPRIETTQWQDIINEHLTFGRWLVGSSLVQFLSSNWLIMMSGAMLGASTVGIFKSAQYLTGGVTMLFQALENVVPLRLARLYRLSDQTLRCKYIKSVALFLLIFISIYIAIMIHFIPFFLHYMQIQDETMYYRLASALLFQSFLLGPVLLLTYILRAQSHTKAIFYTNTITALFTLLTGPLIIMTWHEMGIVYGLSAIQFIVMICLSVFVIRRWHA